MSKLPTLRPSLLDYLVEQKRGAARQARTSAFARSGTSVTAEGVTTVDGINQSFDFDGTGPSDMGTKGWALGSTNGGPSWFIINGHMIFDDLMAQDARITAQVAALASAVADIATLVGQQVTGSTGNANSGVVGFTTGYVTYATVTIAVPAGYSVARVIGISSAFCPGSGGAMTARTRISGNVGNAMTGVTDSSISHALTLTGLSGGNITIATDVMVNTAANGAANTSAFVTFLR